jgi:hypothetical protein
MDTPTRKLGQFRSGAAWTGNAGGRPKTYAELRAMCQEKTIEGVKAVEEILWDPAQPGSTRVSAWVALRDCGFDRPAQRIAFRDFTEHPTAELPKDGDSVDHFADIYKRMLEGAVIDVIPPPRPKALSAPKDDKDVSIDELRELWAAEDAAEQRSQPQPQPRERERIVRRRGRQTKLSNDSLLQRPMTTKGRPKIPSNDGISRKASQHKNLRI